MRPVGRQPDNETRVPTCDRFNFLSALVVGKPIYSASRLQGVRGSN